MSKIETQSEARPFPLNRREITLSALFGGALGLVLTGSALRLAEILFGQ